MRQRATSGRLETLVVHAARELETAFLHGRDGAKMNSYHAGCRSVGVPHELGHEHALGFLQLGA